MRLGDRKMLRTKSCKIVDFNECDILYQATYIRQCENCDYEDSKERHFTSILKSGTTIDMDNWHCPKCGHLNITEIVSKS